MIYNVLLIGSGNVGSRHLQGILKSNYNINIHIVEVNPQSIKITRKRILEVKFKKKKIFFHKNINFKKVNFDLAIIATSSHNRLNIVKKMLKLKNIKNCIVEKIAFQTTKDYEKAEILFQKKRVNCWVNCARNYHPIYALIKKKINKYKKIKMHVKGNGWNMASNSIHFVELMNYMGLRSISEKGYYSKKNDIINSKRSGYKEVKGIFKISNKFGDVLTLEDNYLYKKYSLEITIKNQKNIFIIDEDNNVAKSGVFRNNKYYFKELKQSNLSKKYIESIINKKKILLPTLNKSFSSHKFLLKLIIDNLKFKKYLFKYCPVT